MATLAHAKLHKLLQLAYSAERAAAFAYIGHAKSLKDPAERAAVEQVERDEWEHREAVYLIMQEYEIPISRYYEIKYYVIGRIISMSCYVIGRFMPYYFAGRLESGNVCEYFHMLRYFHELGIYKHDQVLFDMGVKEKEHEELLLKKIAHSKIIGLFECIFTWGRRKKFNDLDLEKLPDLERADQYCKQKTSLNVNNAKQHNDG